MSAEDDFGLWERELRPEMPEPSENGSGARGMVVAAGVTAVGCAALITMGEPSLGIVGLVVASLILLLWRLGM